MNTDKLRNILAVRINLHPNDDFGTAECWEKELQILTEDVTDTISFLENESTNEEFYWISEVFQELSEKVQSKKLIQAMRSRLDKISRESYNQISFESEHIREWVDYDEYVRDVSMEIDYAEGALNDE